jgi:hypothetical protein
LHTPQFHKISKGSIFIKPYEHKEIAIWIMPPFFKNKKEQRSFGEKEEKCKTKLPS